MRCPKCSCLDDKVVDSRVSKEGDAIRRRRECTACGHRFSTRESIVGPEMLVVKRDGAREEFDAEKIRLGVRRACWKRPVSEEQIDKVVAETTAAVTRTLQREVPSKVVGQFVMDALQDLDEVAYVRFASVYRRFKGVGQFIDEVQSLAEAQSSRSVEP